MINNIRIALRFALGAVFGLCAADGISQVRGLPLLPPLWENIAVAVFFLLAAAALVLAFTQGDRKALGRMKYWTVSVLLGSVALVLVLWAGLALNWPSGLMNAIVYALAVVSSPVVSCTVMFWPIFGWALLLVVSLRLDRSLTGADGGRHRKTE